MKQKGRVTVASGSMVPTKRTRWQSAFEKLNEAHMAVSIMESAGDRVSFEEAWSSFVDALQESWTRFFDEGKSVSSNFQPWAGQHEAKLRDEPLVSYLRQARHQSQHGRIPMSWEDEKLQIAPGFSGHIQSLKVFEDGTFEVEATPVKGSNTDVKLVHDLGNPSLPEIRDKRSNTRYRPPKGLESPVDAAHAGIACYETIYMEAVEKFGPDS